MNDELASSEIARLEERIDELRQAIDRCDKLAWAAKVAIAGGALWFVLALVNVLIFSATGFTGALAALLGGFVLLGSNQTTRNETEAALHAADERRRALIDTMQLRLVEESDTTIH
ncbi:hypothetical protein [Undibacter mobilis]|uniref:Uncharacterized protein n=1 Tax=Undibacter mobilis TaxID=2292256 RepID=A0A371B7I6_9BRAD|nr:hypothetical protein [Undibacter mobilis]RDV03482.1 hypothetical protein DXH78_02065 [Undibacter mobilis]